MLFVRRWGVSFQKGGQRQTAIPVSMLFSLLGVCPSQATAAEAGADELYLGVAGAGLYSEHEFTASIPSVISATRLSQSPHDAPASITVIDRETIEASGFTEIPDLLRLVPGFQASYATDGSHFAVNYHAYVDAWSRRIQVLVDGRSVTVPALNNVDWNNLGISLEDIDRIEVIRGPSAVAYGANAFTAAINIITRQPFQDRGSQVSITGGSLATRNIYARHGGNIDDWDYRLSTSYRSDDGFAGIDDHKRIGTITLRAGYNPRYDENVDVQLGYSGGEFGTWGIMSGDDPTNPVRVSDIDSYYGLVRWQRTVSAGEALHLQLYHHHYDKQEGFTSALLSELLGIDDPALIPILFGGHQDQTFEVSTLAATAERYDLELQHTFLPSPAWRIGWGGNLRLDRLKSIPLLDSSHYLDDRAMILFGNAEWHAGRSTVVNIGVMGEYHDATGTEYSSRLGLNYHLMPRHSLRLSASNTIRAPSIYENNAYNDVEFDDGEPLLIFADSRGNLDPERIRAFEVGYLGEFPQQGITVDLKAFHEESTKLIDNVYDQSYAQPWPILDGLANILVYDNVGEITVQGFEGQVDYRPSTRSRLLMQYGYLDMTGTKREPINPDTYRDLSDHAPRHTFSALFTHRFHSRADASLGVYAMNGFTWAGEGDSVDTWRRFDGRIGWGLGSGGRDGKLELIVQNLLNEPYPEFVQENVFSRRTLLRITTKL